uniref:Uncharacterized protein n=1 Tax=Klebsiella pneumoniae TaxID=573 RepID=A0A8B0SSH7_KLEPN|nr:hypothetical protein [Klebsiella pneumoniae]
MFLPDTNTIGVFNCIWENVEVAEEIEAYAACPAMKKTGTV